MEGKAAYGHYLETRLQTQTPMISGSAFALLLVIGVLLM